MSLENWVPATQRHYGGVSGGYKSGFANWSSSVDGVHENSLLAKGPHDVYIIRDSATGQLLHFGETGRGYLTRFTVHQRAFAASGIEIEVNFLRMVEGKAAAKALEFRYIETYTKTYGRRPSHNPCKSLIMKILLSVGAENRHFAKNIRLVRPSFDSLFLAFSLVKMVDPIHDAILIGVTDAKSDGYFEIIPNKEVFFKYWLELKIIL